MLTFGTIMGLIALAAGIVLLFAAALALFAIIHWDLDESLPFVAMGGIMAFLGCLPAIIAPLIGFGVVGWSPDYLTYKPVHGTVEQVASRQISDGKAMSTRYVVQIKGQPYGIDDTRAALLKAGDTVDLNCTKEFVWGSTNNGYACNWG